MWYDKQHISLDINVNDEVYLCLNQEYQLLRKLLLKVLSQHCSSFKIIEKMRRLTFQLTLLEMWRIHSVMSILQLKLISEIDSYKQSWLEQLSSVEVNRKLWYIINHIISKKCMKHFKETHYLVWWKGFAFEENTWKLSSRFIDDNQMKEINIYENFHDTHENIKTDKS